ncbi:MFS-type transporter SLC18B1 [Parasteatoda tepidariorum]|uniref:MFS-type transporter SLC18B1 n=1 Tax=Parasteatoda tepidariorum TaxID=114398 RepID=UPI00077FA7DA|nr:MFS-type transporter SLC18B1 [Parasteatoda tepidariorum]XP_015916844.1 MFS-type transporter SLC18B1 [Parasteatoda tepidariorum]XP_042899883.1 MFS-type transporter SLC18B1 [Parasteatoda tepidariorum]
MTISLSTDKLNKSREKLNKSQEKLNKSQENEKSKEYSSQEIEKPAQTSPRAYKKMYIIISLVYANFWMAASVSLQAPFFPKEAESKGATPTQYGLVFGVFELVVIIMSPIYGKLIPRVSPKFLITCGVFVGGVACCVFGVLDYVPAGKQYIALAFVVRIVEGFGAAALMTASFTIVAAAFPESVATSFSLMETAFGIGLIVGPTIGGALYQAGGFLLPFVVNGGFLVCGSFVLAFLLPKIEDTERHEGSRNLWAFLFDGGIISFTLSIISSLLFIGFNAATLEPHLRQFNLAPVILGVIFVITGGIYAITTPIWGKICDIGVNPLVIGIGGYCMSVVGILFIGPVPFIPFKPTLWTVIGSLVVVGLGLSAKLVSSFIGALKNVIHRGFPDNLATYGMVSALFSTACSTGAFIGPSLGGFLLDTTGYRMGTVVILSLEIFFMVILVTYVVYSNIKKRNAERDECEREPLMTSSVTRRSYSYSSV